MSWQLCIFLSVIFYSLSTLFQRTVLKDEKSNPVIFSILSSIIIALITGGYGIIIGQFHWPIWNTILLPLVLMTFLYALGSVAVQFALKHTEASNFTILFSGRGLVTLISATLLLHEPFSFKSLIGATLVIASIVVVTMKGKDLQLKRGDLFALGAAVCFGLANTNDRSLLKSVELYPYLFIAFLFPALLITLTQRHPVAEVAQMMRSKLFPKFLSYCVLYALSALTFFASLRIAPSASQVSLVSLTSTIIIVILSMIFLGERDSVKRKILGAVMSVIGIALLTA